MKQIQIEAYGSSVMGRNKTANEDAFYYSVVDAGRGHAGLFVVCDGVGGLQHGAETSQQVAAAAKRWWKNDFSVDMTFKNCADSFIQQLDRANSRIIEKAQEQGSKTATTIAALVLYAGYYIIVNAGDSRVYRLGRDTQKELKQLSQDHTTTVATQTKDGIRQKRVLTEHIGHSETVHYYVAQGRVKPGERFFVCSDGVYKLVAENEMESLVRESADAQQASEQLVAAAVGKGESDDVTAITISIS